MEFKREAARELGMDEDKQRMLAHHVEFCLLGTCKSTRLNLNVQRILSLNVTKPAIQEEKLIMHGSRTKKMEEKKTKEKGIRCDDG